MLPVWGLRVAVTTQAVPRRARFVRCEITQDLANLLRLFRSIDREVASFDQGHPDPDSVFEKSKLFKALRDL